MPVKIKRFFRKLSAKEPVKRPRAVGDDVSVAVRAEGLIVHTKTYIYHLGLEFVPAPNFLIYAKLKTGRVDVLF